MHRARQYTICSNRKDFDRLVSQIEEQARFAKDSLKEQDAHMAEIWPVRPGAPQPSVERLEAIRAYALAAQGAVDDMHSLMQSSLELLKVLGTTPIACP